MIEGLNIRCNLGSVEILRSPYIELSYKRRAVLSRGVVEIPDPYGLIRAALSIGQNMSIRFGYRGLGNMWHEWQGSIEKIDQPRNQSENPDALIVQGVGLEKKLMTTFVTESFYNEHAKAVANRLLLQSGLPVNDINIPDELLEHQVFSHVPIARAIKQLEHSLQSSFKHNLSKHALWLGKKGLSWSDSDEPGDIYTIATADNLIEHLPPKKIGDMGLLVSVLLPGLIASQKVRIADMRRNINALVRAEEIIHILKTSGNTSTIMYGKQAGWG